MNARFLARGLAAVAAAALLVAAVGFAVMTLWNWLVPALAAAHWQTLSLGQAVVLLVLCRLLFGSFRRHGHGGWRHRVRTCRVDARADQPHVEAGFRARCGGTGRDPA